MSRPKPPQDPADLLEKTLHLIAQDLEYIKEANVDKQLDADISGRLVRYSDALLKHVKERADDEDSQKRKLAKMSTAELAGMAEELAKQAREKK